MLVTLRGVCLEKKNDELQKKADCLEKLFHADQVYKILYPDSKKTWSDITLEMAIALYYKVGSTGYNYLRDVLKWPLLCPSVIQSNMRRVKFKPGNDGCLDILKLIALKTRELPENERFYCLVIDEMATNLGLSLIPFNRIHQYMHPLSDWHNNSFCINLCGQERAHRRTWKICITQAKHS